MDFVETEREFRKISEAQTKLARSYAVERDKFGQAHYNLRILLVPHQEDDRYRKASFEKQLNMLMADTPENHKPEVYKYVEDYTKSQQRYKGLEKMLEARQDDRSGQQSLMKYARNND